jgi:hypothetical protein
VALERALECRLGLIADRIRHYTGGHGWFLQLIGRNSHADVGFSNGPLIWWMYPAFGVRGASWFLGVAEWTFGALLFAGFWDKRLSILGAAGSVVTFVMTVTIIPSCRTAGRHPQAAFRR